MAETAPLQRIWIFRGVETFYGEKYLMWEHFATGERRAQLAANWKRRCMGPAARYHAEHSESAKWRWDCDICNPVTQDWNW